MDSFNAINTALDYAESKLTEDIEMEAIAKLVGCSPYNFQRMFSFLTNTSFAEYIRNRRLSLAAVDLQQGGSHVSDVACKYGYSSPTAFTRAFAAFHGITPQQAKQQKTILKVYPRITFSLSIQGGRQLAYRIETLPAFAVCGIEHLAPMTEQGFASPAAFWQQSFQNGSIQTLLAESYAFSLPLFPNALPLYGVANYRDTGQEIFPYMICFASKEASTRFKTSAFIPPQTYAVLKSEPYPIENVPLAQEKATQLQRQFYREWLPTVNYQKATGPELEVYYQDGEKACLEIWVPVEASK